MTKATIVLVKGNATVVKSRRKPTIKLVARLEKELAQVREALAKAIDGLIQKNDELVQARNERDEARDQRDAFRNARVKADNEFFDESFRSAVKRVKPIDNDFLSHLD